MKELLKYSKDIYSQNGEDGIINFILDKIKPNEPGFFVEFGGWDGKHLSNTYQLAEKGWSGLYIESDTERHKECIENTKMFKGRVKSINKEVSINGESSLNTIFTNEKIDKDFDLLSIDVDGIDYYIWESLTTHNPKIVIIEINSSIPIGAEQKHDMTHNYQGSSYTTTVNLGTLKGYKLLCCTGNLIFLRNDINFNYE